MDADRLASLLEQPAVQRQILKQYEGGYSIGVIASPANPAGLAIRVRIESQDDSQIARHLVVDGETIPVLVHTGFKLPKPL